VTEASASYDVAVLGGGPAGSAAAIELSKRGQRVLVLERSLYDESRIGETLAPQVTPWLHRLGIGDAFASVPHVPAPRVVRQWERAAPTADPLGFKGEPHGWHVDRARFDALLGDVAERAGAAVRRGANAVSFQRQNGDGWRLELDWRDRRVQVEARRLIDATGRRGMVLRREGIRPSLRDRLVGLLGYGGPRTSGDPALFVEATPLGWWYSAPLPGQRSVAAFMTDGDLIARDGRGMASFWEDQRAASELISRLHRSEVSVRPVVARTAWAGTVTGAGWLAVGEAAMGFDPLFGFGVCQALASGWMAARALLEEREQGATALGKYQSWSESQFDGYMARRKQVYASVTRWPDSPFWRRRAS
jgi:flavin-dependent dehydrogenase